jgi:two-component system, OmpR family, response regulator
MRVLLIEDDQALSLGVQRALEREGWRVDALADGRTALAAGLGGEHDLAVLDLGLPGCDGMEVLRHWRGRGVTIPVLLLTARDELADRVKGLDSGADDFLAKPFDTPELLARLRALKRRAAGHLEQRLTLGDLELDVTGRELRFAGVRVPLSPRELALTELLMQKAGRVVTKESIVARLSSWEADFSENSVEVYVHRLRKRFGDLGVVIRTIRGFGYVMEATDGPAATPT